MFTRLQAMVGVAAIALAAMPPMGAVGLSAPIDAAFPIAQTVEVEAPAFEFPLPGEFLADGRPAAAPSGKIEVRRFRIMKRQVGLADYGRCVAAGTCAAPDARPTTEDVPVTGVNWTDAEAYARWYSEATGETWRLPTAAEAAAAAGERFGGDPFSAAADDDSGNPAIRWIRRYREEAAARRPADPEPKPRGHYGPNSLGVEDFGGNVWEWTSTCYNRVTVDAGGKFQSVIENCGVHVLEGRHRAYMSNFIRNGKSGGCAMGTPPENLGFRLVLDERPFPLIGGFVDRLKTAMARTSF